MFDQPLLLVLGLLLTGLVVYGLIYLVRALAYAYIYITTAMSSQRAGSMTRKCFPRMAKEVDEARDASPRDILGQTDELFRGGLAPTLRKLLKTLLTIFLALLLVMAAVWLLKYRIVP